MPVNAISIVYLHNQLLCFFYYPIIENNFLSIKLYFSILLHYLQHTIYITVFKCNNLFSLFCNEAIQCHGRKEYTRTLHRQQHSQ
jgi:hypothetical protein